MSIPWPACARRGCCSSFRATLAHGKIGINLDGTLKVGQRGSEAFALRFAARPYACSALERRSRCPRQRTFNFWTPRQRLTQLSAEFRRCAAQGVEHSLRGSWRHLLLRQRCRRSGNSRPSTPNTNSLPRLAMDPERYAVQPERRQSSRATSGVRHMVSGGRIISLNVAATLLSEEHFQKWRLLKCTVKRRLQGVVEHRIAGTDFRSPR